MWFGKEVVVVGASQFNSVAQQFLPKDIADAVPEALCEKLARTHYENFPIGSIFLPAKLRKHVYNIYTYCRLCDDLADETGDPQLSLELLHWWREELHSCFAGKPNHPVYAALKPTIDMFDLPIEPFDDLISAFVQDQTTIRYETFDQLKDYCRRSANPVGRLFLYLMGYRDEARARLSDFTCTGLQLINFWQDVAPDYQKGRIYIPQEDMRRFGYTEAELKNRVTNAAFVQLMRFELKRTREFFDNGATLGRLVEGPGAADVDLFNRCGVALVNSIERSGCDVLNKRITVSKGRKLLIALGWAARKAIGR